MFVEFCYPAFKTHVPCYIYICCLSPSAAFFTLFQISQFFFWKIKAFLEILKVWLKHFYFKKNWRDIMINASMLFIKYPTCFSDFKGIWFSPQISEWYSKIKLNDSLQSGSQFAVNRRQLWWKKYSSFVIPRTLLKLWLSFVVSFNRPNMKILTFTFS